MELQGLLLVAIGTLGFISLCNHLANIFNWVWVMFLRPPKNLKRYGSWAVITGSTDGIGRALALELASKGLNLVLVGRNPLKLEATSEKIRERNGRQVAIKTIVIDFAKLGGEEIGKKMEEGIEGLDVGILVNNAGLAYPYAKFFHEVDIEMMESVIGVNMVGTTWVTKSVLPGMLKKKKGAILNIGSGSSGAVSSYPLYTIYAATKAYIAQFSRCISLEYKQHGIDVQCQPPDPITCGDKDGIHQTIFLLHSLARDIQQSKHTSNWLRATLYAILATFFAVVRNASATGCIIGLVSFSIFPWDAKERAQETAEEAMTV